MTLFDITKKNMKGNFKNYLVYLVSMLFSVVIYYTFVSLQYSTEIAKSIESSESMQSIFMIASILLILFVSIFILYSNNSFGKKRKKEIGLYALFGLPKKTIGKMLFYENMIMGAIVLIVGIAIGTFLSKLFTMILLKLLGVVVDVGMTLSIEAVLNTIVVFTIIILFTSFQGYRMIYKYELVELFIAEQEGEQEPKASVVSAVLAIILLTIGYWAGFQRLSTTDEILKNIIIMAFGIIAGTILLFSSLVVISLKMVRRNKKNYYKGMNIVSISNLVYRIKGNARTLSIISLLSAVALCAFSVGLGMYYSFEETSRLAAPFSYMYIEQDYTFNEKVESIIRSDEEHPVSTKMIIPIIKCKGESSSHDILSTRDIEADENPIKVIAISNYNKIAKALNFSILDSLKDGKAIGIRPMYTDYKPKDYIGETIALKLPEGDMVFEFVGMTIERVINWSFPDVMIVVDDDTYEKIQEQATPINYVGYAVDGQKTTKETADALAAIKTPESELSTFYSEYRLGIEQAAFNVFILGFLGLVFVFATGSIIYFKEINEFNADRNKYEILKKVGVSNKEIHKSILKQTAFIFILPLIVGIAHYIVIINLLSRLFSIMTGINLALPIIICVATFIMIYAAYYVITVNSISTIINVRTSSTIKIGMIIILVLAIAMIGVFIWLDTPTQVKETYTGDKIHLNLPDPTGEYRVGTIEMHLVDDNRMDPWVKDKERELMISIWYPAKEKSERKALFMQPEAAKHYDQNEIHSIGLDPGRIDISGIGTNAWVGAPVAHSEGGWPVILYSPGAGIPRNFGTVLVEELASRGYIVVTVDHTYEVSVVEFPDGRIITQELPSFSAEVVLKVMDVRVDDMKFILDQLTRIKNSDNPDYEQSELPVGLAETLNLSKVGIFGHSAGGATAAQLMYEDDRVDAGIDMDGTMGHMPENPLPVAQYGLNRPFMLMNAGYNDDGEVDCHLSAEDRRSFWENSNGWKLDISIPNGAHFTFTDYLVLLPQLENKLSISRYVIQQSIGTVDYEQILEAQRNYIVAFFDLHLKEIPQSIFDESSMPYSDVKIVE